MDERRTEPLTDAALDREIQAAVAVDPSNAFVARVRERIATEPSPAIWWTRWTLATGGAAVVGVTVVLALSTWKVPSPREPLPDTAMSARFVEVGAPAAADAPKSDEKRLTPKDTRPKATTATSRGPSDVVHAVSPVAVRDDGFPEVIIAETERRALRSLADAGHEYLADITEVSTSPLRAASERPVLPPVSFEQLALGHPVFQPVDVE